MRVAVACDHGGYPLKLLVKETLTAYHAEVIDLGSDSFQSVDYPDYASRAIELFLQGGCDRIVLICGTGIGMSICANRFPGIRAALCSDSFTARMSRQHNDANCLVLGARVIGPGLAEEIVKIWFTTDFEGGRHEQRLVKIEELTKKVKGSSKR
jgi:ribose 5-phosphate isomerase B